MQEIDFDVKGLALTSTNILTETEAKLRGCLETKDFKICFDVVDKNLPVLFCTVWKV